MGDAIRGEHAAGDLIGDRYEIVGVLGRGGMAVTYQAIDRHSAATVAVKQLALWGANEWKGLELFEREAKTLAGLSHPCVPRYLDYLQVETADGPAFYLVRELVEGVSLEEWIGKGARLDEAGVKDVARRLLGVLADLHALTPPLVHRDIKPSNVLRREDGQLMLVDFGAVRRPDGPDGSTLVGTYGYMAPEQFRGHAELASDLYGLGATLLFLLTHVPPSELPQRGLRVEFRGSVTVSAPFADWLERMLEPDPERRFPSAAKALAALDLPEKRSSRPAPPPAAPQRLPMRRMVALIGLAALMVFAAASAAVAFRAELAGGGPSPEPPRSAGAAEAKGAFVPALHAWQAVNGVADAVAFVGNTKQLVVASRSGSVKLWDADDERLLRTFQRGKPSDARSLAVDAAGKLLATAAGKDVQLWSLADGAARAVLSGHTRQVLRLAMSPDGAVAVSGGSDGRVIVWDLATARARLTLDHPGGGTVNAVALSRDAQRVASGGANGKIRVWDASTGAVVRDLAGHAREVDELAFTSDGAALASASDDGTVVKWAVREGKSLCTMAGHDDEVWAVAISPDDRTLLSGTKSDVLFTWSFDTCSEITRQPARLHGIASLTFSADGAVFAAVGPSGTVGVWRAPGRIWRAPIPPADYLPPARAKSEAHSPEERLVADAEDLLDRMDEGTDVGDARERLREALRANAQYAPAHAQLARCEYLGTQRIGGTFDATALKRARAEVDEALRLEPRLAMALRVKARIAVHEKNFGEARALAADARAIEPDDLRGPLLSAFIASHEKQDDEVIAACRTVIEGSKDAKLLLEAYGLLGESYRRMKEWNGTDDAYQAQLRLAPKSAWARGNYAQFLIGRDQCDDALRVARQALDLFDYGAGRMTLGSAHVCKAETAIRRNDLEAGLAEIAAAEKVAGETSDVARVRGFYFVQRATVERKSALCGDARRAFERALQLEPGNAAARRGLDDLPSYCARLDAN